MRSTLPMRTAKIGYIIFSAILCVLGVTLIAFPDFSASMLGTICGVVLIGFGCIKLIGYFSRDLFRLAFQFDLEFGILSLVLGILLLVRPGNLVNFTCVALGISFLADALFKIRITLEAKRFGIHTWWVVLALAIATGAFGTVLAFRPGAGSTLLMIFLGVTLLLEGVLNMSTALTMVKIVSHQRPDVIESSDFIESEENRP